ncbi:MAG: peptidylprolyl isomerase [Halobacteria archaeon]|nr:peptidylprolyl isomerase [Halobacteria archaeon]
MTEQESEDEETQELEESEEVEEEVEEDKEKEAETETETEEAEEEEEGEGLQEGDFVRLHYTATTGDGTVIDTTHKEIAEEEDLDTEREFGPRILILGEGHIFEEVENDLIGKQAGYKGEVQIPAEDAFGEHDPDNVETVSAKRIPEDDRYPGAQVEIDGDQGYVETIIGGRARIDFNHPLAGEDITYEFEVVDVVEDKIEKAQGMIDLYAGVKPDISFGTETRVETRVEEDDEGEEEEVEEEVEIDVMYIEASPELTFSQNWLFSKSQIAHDLMHRFDVDRVVVRETFDEEGFHGGPGMGMGGMDVEDLEEMGVEEAIEGVEDVEDIEDLEELEVEEDVEE